MQRQSAAITVSAVATPTKGTADAAATKLAAEGTAPITEKSIAMAFGSPAPESLVARGLRVVDVLDRGTRAMSPTGQHFPVGLKDKVPQRCGALSASAL